MKDPVLTSAIEKAKLIIKSSKNEEDLSHAQNTMQWIRRLRPEADRVLLFAGYAHDIQRGLPDRLQKADFDTYDDYQWAHAKRSAEVAHTIAKEAGFDEEECRRLFECISEGEFHSEKPDVQLLRDANSISIFDNNTRFYMKNKGKDWTQEKMQKNYAFASEVAKKHINHLLHSRPDENLLNV